MSDTPEPKIAHIVFFTLKDRTDAARSKLLAACEEYLAGHDGVEYYSAGVLAPEFDRPVNDHEFDVALHVVFDCRASHDAYQQHPRHLEFIAQNKDTWAKVRVFDSRV